MLKTFLKKSITTLAVSTVSLGLISGAALASGTKTTSSDTSFLTGDLAQQFDLVDPAPVNLTNLKTIDGTPINMDDFLGHVTVVNFWATWCAPCKHEMPTLNNAATQWGKDGLKVIAASVDSDRAKEKADNYLKKQGYSDLIFAHDSKLVSIREAGGVGVPYTVVLDKQGMEVGRLAGTTDWDNEDAGRLFQHFLAKAAGDS